MITERLEQLFGDAIELPPSERKTFLERTCASEPELLQRLEAMIETHTRARGSSFFASKTPSPGQSEPANGLDPICFEKRSGKAVGSGLPGRAGEADPAARRLKVIKPGMDTRNVIARFEAEREALAMMDHPNIAKVLDAGATESAGLTSSWNWSPEPHRRSTATRSNFGLGRPAGIVHEGLPGRAACAPEGHHSPGLKAVQHPGR